MKYVRKIIVLLIGLVFFAAIVISLGMIFAVRNINVTMITYADAESEIYSESFNNAKTSLEVFKGESILFVGEKSVAGIVKDSNYTLDSFEKKYPCTINISLRERLETFSVSVGGMYSMYDSDGRHLRNSAENNNVNDGTPNVELLAVPIDKIESVAHIAGMFKSSFGGLRSLVAAISIDSSPEIEGYTERLYFNLRCGLKIQIVDYSADTAEKINEAYKKFVTLTDRQKLSGTIRSYRIGGENGLINADYSKI